MTSMLKELEMREDIPSDLELKTIYFGGGTPSAVHAVYLEELVEGLGKRVKMGGVEEFTLEANPDDVFPEQVKKWKAMGVNRLSIGVQSTYDSVLHWMNRSHSSRQAERAVKTAQDYGISNISVDLIFGHGKLEAGQWSTELERFLSWETPHISAYTLTVEEGTAFGHWRNSGRLILPHDEQVVEEFMDIHQRFLDHGYRHYELSNYAKEGYISKHNSSYWRGTPYVGIGPSAHSFNGISQRKFNISNNAKYVKWIEEGQEEFGPGLDKLSEDDQVKEYWMLGLRTEGGVEIDQFERRWSLNLGAEKWKKIRNWENSGHLKISQNTISCTPIGWIMLDAILVDLF
jgi:oxygen-independent coproporphyrinogen-3 oxidase